MHVVGQQQGQKHRQGQGRWGKGWGMDRASGHCHAENVMMKTKVESVLNLFLGLGIQQVLPS